MRTESPGRAVYPTLRRRCKTTSSRVEKAVSTDLGSETDSPQTPTTNQLVEIAQRPQALDGGLVERLAAWPLRRAHGRGPHLVEDLREARHLRRRGGLEVTGFTRILFEIVELRPVLPCRGDQLVAVAADRGDRSLAVFHRAIDRAHRRLAGGNASGEQRRQQTGAVHGRLHASASQIEDGGRDVGERHRLVD